jgi:excisionase family DNA binding protein
MPGDGPTKLYKVSEVAKAARQTPPTIYNHIQKGAIRSVKVGGSVRIPEDSAREYLGEDAPRLLSSDK